MIDPDSRASSQRDRLAERLLTTGCVLLVIPAIFMVCAVLWFGWPIVTASLFDLF